MLSFVLRVGFAAVGSLLAFAGGVPVRPAHSSRKPKPAVEIHFTGKHAFARLLGDAHKDDWANEKIGDLAATVGLSLIDTPYVSHTLDHSADHEYCIVDLQGLDCVTFVESSLALARTIKMGLDKRADLAGQVIGFRYRNGKCNGFCSRLHYLSDWFYDNARRGLIEPYTASLPGAVEVKKKICLMSERPYDYLQLRKHPEWIPIIAKWEKAISARPLCYLPKAKIASDEQYMKSGDVVAITTSAGILDCAHTGLCYRDGKGVLRFLHASSKHKKVTLDEELAVYLGKNRDFTGVMLAHPLSPRTD